MKTALDRFVDDMLAGNCFQEQSTPSQPLSPKQKLPLDYRALYQQMTEAIHQEGFILDPHWLIDHHSELWHEIVRLDDALSRAEREGDADFYRETTQLLCDVVLRARTLSMLEQRQNRAAS